MHQNVTLTHKENEISPPNYKNWKIYLQKEMACWQEGTLETYSHNYLNETSVNKIRKELNTHTGSLNHK